MTSSRRVKLSVSLPEDLVRAVDRRARALADATRSSVIEQWLRTGARAQDETDLREAVIAYYEELSATDRAEDEALARASSRNARKLRFE